MSVVTRFLRGSRPVVAHRELAHAHWDPASRRWVTHEEVLDRAA